MCATIFAIANQKGGVGKTTTAVNLAAGLANLKVPTLLIDLDPQANATSSLGIEKTPGASLYPCFHEQDRASTKVLETSTKNLSIIPSETDLAALETELPQQGDYLLKLKHVLQPVVNSKAFRAIILDCPPAIGMLSMNALAVADFLLVALQCEYLALEGLSQILALIDELKSAEVNPDLELGGLAMTMFDVRTRLSRQVVEEVKTHFPDKIFKTFIPRSIRLSEAPSFGKTIFQYDPESSGAKAYAALAKELKRRFDIK